MKNYEDGLVKLQGTFDHFITDHWSPLQYLVLSFHDSLCRTCNGSGETDSGGPPAVRATLS